MAAVVAAILGAGVASVAVLTGVVRVAVPSPDTVGVGVVPAAGLSGAATVALSTPATLGTGVVPVAILAGTWMGVTTGSVVGLDSPALLYAVTAYV
jgi:hypothetical protein